MKFRTYNEGGDTQLFVATDDKGRNTIIENEFVFTGFKNEIHPYHRKWIVWIVEMLKTKGIILNVAEVPTVKDMADDIDSGEFSSVADLKIPKGFDKKSVDGHTYILFQDVEMGRGWACLIKDNEIMDQEHRDTVLDELKEGEWIRSFGIDYEMETVADLSSFMANLK